MATRYRRKSLQELINAGDRWMSGLVVLFVVCAIYGLLDRLGQG
jgi:hypothetical protein